MSRRIRRRHRRRPATERLAPIVDGATDIGWIDWGGDRMFVVDYTPAGFPIGLREEEIEELEWLTWLDTLEPPDAEGR